MRAAARARPGPHDLREHADPAASGVTRGVEGGHLARGSPATRPRAPAGAASRRGRSCRRCGSGRRACPPARARRAARRRRRGRRRPPSRARRARRARAGRCPAGRRARRGRRRCPRAVTGAPLAAIARSSPLISRLMRLGTAVRRGAGASGADGCGRGGGDAAARAGRRPAHAAFQRTPIGLGAADGGSPSVVMDAAGTAHVAWGIAEELIGVLRDPARRPRLRADDDARARRPLRPARHPAPPAGRRCCRARRPRRRRRRPRRVRLGVRHARRRQLGRPVPIGRRHRRRPRRRRADRRRRCPSTCSSPTPAATCSSARRSPARPRRVVLNLDNRPDGTTGGFDYPGDLVRLRNGRTLALLGSPADGFGYRVLKGADPFADAVLASVPRPARHPALERAARRGRPARRVRDVRRHVLDQAYGAAPQVIRRLRARGWGRPRGLFYEVAANTSTRRRSPRTAAAACTRRWSATRTRAGRAASRMRAPARAGGSRAPLARRPRTPRARRAGRVDCAAAAASGARASTTAAAAAQVGLGHGPTGTPRSVARASRRLERPPAPKPSRREAAPAAGRRRRRGCPPLRIR